ncbi:MAG: SusF/SusE family outer membrane protein [Flavobacteriaceae bacterium]|nr:SusF/SusE family outer membrane protein [Flavobacteriaceae bacterium]
MKRIIYIFTTLVAFTLVGCYGDDVSVEMQEASKQSMNSEVLTKAKLKNLSADTFEVKQTTDKEKGNENEVATTISWEASITNTSEKVAYMVQLDVANNKFETAVNIPLGSSKTANLSQELTYEQLNNAVNRIAINLKSIASALSVKFDEANDFEIRLVSILGANIAMKYSELAKVSITPYFTGLVDELVFSGEATSNVDTKSKNTDGRYEARLKLVANKIIKLYAVPKDKGISYSYDYFANKGYTIDDKLVNSDNEFQFTGNAGTWDIVINSNDKTITLSEVIIPDNLYMVGSYNDWNNADATQEFTNLGNGVFIKVQKFDAGAEFKLLPNLGDWEGDWGMDKNNEGHIIQKGDNIPVVEAGTYMVRIDFNTLTYEVSPIASWGLVGNATPNGWNGPDIPFYLNKSNVTEFVAYAVLKDGSFKIRKDNKWDTDYGSSETENMLKAKGGNISVTSGTYKIVFNPEAKSYTIEAHSWGIVGSATPNDWNGPDIVLTPDANAENVWKASNVELKDGEIKFRLNNDWNQKPNYGDNEVDGSLEADGKNIAVTAGTYDVVLDLSKSDAPTYTLNKVK